MPHITVDETQAQLIRESEEPVEVRDENGQCLGYLSHGFTEDDLAEAERRSQSKGPWYTTAEVLEHLRSLKAQ